MSKSTHRIAACNICVTRTVDVERDETLVLTAAVLVLKAPVGLYAFSMAKERKENNASSFVPAVIESRDTFPHRPGNA